MTPLEKFNSVYLKREDKNSSSKIISSGIASGKNA